mgnify:FL=1
MAKWKLLEFLLFFYDSCLNDLKTQASQKIIQKKVLSFTELSPQVTTPLTMYHHHGHHYKHHHHHPPLFVVEPKPIRHETVIVEAKPQPQPVFVQKTVPTSTIITTTPTYTTPTYTVPMQTYTTQPTYTTPTMTPTYTTQTYSTPTSFDPTKHPNFRGALGSSTKHFSDQPLLSKFSNDQKIAIINIAHNGKTCTGVSAQYYIFSQNVTIKGDQHYGTAHPWGGKDESILLDIDEYIVEIFGRQSKWIDSLGFKTNKGRIVEFGGQTGTFFNIVAPPGYHFSCLAGGVGEVLDYIAFEVAPIPVKQTFTPTTTTTTMGLQTNSFGMQQQPPNTQQNYTPY